MKITPKIAKAIKSALKKTGSPQTFDEVSKVFTLMWSKNQTMTLNVIKRQVKTALDPSTVKPSLFQVDPLKMTLNNARNYALACQDAVENVRDEFTDAQKDLYEKNESLSTKLADEIETRRQLEWDMSNDDSLLNRLEVDVEEHNGFFTKRTLMHNIARIIIKDRKAMKKNEFKNKLKGNDNGRRKER